MGGALNGVNPIGTWVALGVKIVAASLEESASIAAFTILDSGKSCRKGKNRRRRQGCFRQPGCSFGGVALNREKLSMTKSKVAREKFFGRTVGGKLGFQCPYHGRLLRSNSVRASKPIYS